MDAGMEMFKLLFGDEMTGYQKIIQALRLDDLTRYGDIIVTIRVEGRIITELLEFDGTKFNWAWLRDWWEGEEDVQFIGAKYLDDVACVGNHLEYNNGGDKQRWP